MYLLACSCWMNLTNAGLSLNAAATSFAERLRSTFSQFAGRAIVKPSSVTEYSFHPDARPDVAVSVGVGLTAVPAEAPQAASSSATRAAGTHPKARANTVGYM